MPVKTRSEAHSPKSKLNVRISIRARGLGDVLVPRPCFFCVQAVLGTELKAYTEWLPAPVYRAPRHELDFGFIRMMVEDDQLNQIRNTRAPLKLNLLMASKPNPPVPITAGFVTVDSRSITSSEAKELSKQWLQLQSAKCRGIPPQLNVGCKLSWFSAQVVVEEKQAPVAVDKVDLEIATAVEENIYVDDQFEQISDVEDQESNEPPLKPIVAKPEPSLSELKEDIQAKADVEFPGNGNRHESSHAKNPISKESQPENTSRPDILPQATSWRKNTSTYHQYRISVDLCAIRDLPRPGNVYVLYSYPLFKSQVPITTLPPVYVDVNTEVSLPNSFCAFEMEMAQEKLENALSIDPLNIEIILKDDQQIERAIGLATLNLTELLTAPSSPINGGQVRGIDRWVPVFARKGDGSDDVVLSGSLRCALFLEEFDANVAESCRSEKASSSDRPELLDQFSRGSEAYHVAWELEAWKRKQQEAFKQYLEKVEEERRQQIEGQLKELIEEKTTQFSQKEKSISQMERKLQQTLFDLRNKEKTLRQQEEENVKLKESLIRDHELKVKEDAAVIKSLKRQHEQELNLLTREKANLLERLNEMEKLYNEQTELLLGIKRKFAVSASGKLQEELAETKLCLQTADEELSKQKAKEKRTQSQLFACLNELGRLRQASEIIQNERLDQERIELQRVRVQLMAKEREKELGSDRTQLRSIRDEIRKMLSNGSRNDDASPPTGFPLGEPFQENLAATNYVSADHERLCNERTELLHTGIYTEEHDLIKAIDKRIEEIKRENL